MQLEFTRKDLNVLLLYRSSQKSLADAQLICGPKSNGHITLRASPAPRSGGEGGGADDMTGKRRSSCMFSSLFCSGVRCEGGGGAGGDDVLGKRRCCCMLSFLRCFCSGVR